MSASWYALLSLGMRYWFTILAAIIVYRAWRGTVRDNRRARVLRSWAPHTGAIGELIVLTGGSGVRKGSRIPMPKEGLLGSARSADVRLKHRDVKRYHARIEQREDGVLLETFGDAEVWLAGQTGERLLLRDKDRFQIGSLSLMIILYEASAALPEDEAADANDDDLFEAVGVEMRAANPGKAKHNAPKTTRRTAATQKAEPDTRSVKGAKRAPRRRMTEAELFPPFDDGRGNSPE